ncbi:hypothetical protein CHLRE_08g381550v5 [Chlamydomonas reinhardtii]|uniref:Expansin-like EG45 domain-containing protein n=1 Tax=Chlamydomonas reinhardtii TaxID=3055 RepID=A0A2K3DI30_CHLRE|nr:uncharacterized protein CHLRE_08g381550v5 [Chlamydomonas reinhardtii]PNW80185.1 hypothetical protein CHLRE_08g381550v5 [Chlamydomonas reinhardtii]
MVHYSGKGDLGQSVVMGAVASGGGGGGGVGRRAAGGAAVAATPRQRRHARRFVTGAAAAAAAAGPVAATLFPCSIRRYCLVLIAALSATLLLATPAARADDGGGGGGWRYGRATFYGSMGGGSIDDGSCMYGGLPNGMVSTGKDIVALSDTADDYAGSCGRCYEVQCNPASFNDGYGNHIDRTSPCYNGSSVIVTVTDTCPCYYPANQYSNRRWCCGDMYHMDLSSEAFAKLADLGWGVIGTRWRVVGCPGGFQPSPRAASSDFPAGTKKRQR